MEETKEAEALVEQPVEEVESTEVESPVEGEEA